MNSRIKILTIAFMAVTTLGLVSCKKETAKPIITLEELGANNSHQATVGGDLHVEANIVAEGKIDKVMVKIHMEDGSNPIADTTYTEFYGLKNTTFHKHLEIPKTAAVGTYHFHFTVTDLEGNSTTKEVENLQIISE